MPAPPSLGGAAATSSPGELWAKVGSTPHGSGQQSGAEPPSSTPELLPQLPPSFSSHTIAPAMQENSCRRRWARVRERWVLLGGSATRRHSGLLSCDRTHRSFVPSSSSPQEQERNADGEEAPETTLAVCPHGQGEGASRGEHHPLWPGRVEGSQLRVEWPRSSAWFMGTLPWHRTHAGPPPSWAFPPGRGK